MGNKLGFPEFCNQLLSTGDIDPDYLFYRNMLADYPEEQVHKLLLLKLCVYRTESELEMAFRGRSFGEVGYGAERRKFKPVAEKIHAGLMEFHGRNSLDYLRREMSGLPYPLFLKVMSRLWGMGPWAAWKYADLLNKVLGFSITFRARDFLSAYAYPLKGLLMLAGRREDTALYGSTEVFDSDIRMLEAVLQPLKGNYLNMFDPTLVSDYETLLCKYHSHRHGRYAPGEDLNKLRALGENPGLSEFHKYLP